MVHDKTDYYNACNHCSDNQNLALKMPYQEDRHYKHSNQKSKTENRSNKINHFFPPNDTFCLSRLSKLKI